MRPSTVSALANGTEGVYGLNVVRLKEDDYGVYLRRYRGRFGTPLAFRGTEAEVDAWLDEQDRQDRERRERLGLRRA